MRLKVTHSMTKEMADLYNSGTSSYKIGKDFKLAHSTVRIHLMRAGIQMRHFRCKHIDRDTIDRIISLYNRGKSTIDIAKLFPYSKSAVLHILYRHGVKVRSRNRRVITDKEKAQIRAMRWRGVHAKEIARLYKIHQNTVYKIVAVEYDG